MGVIDWYKLVALLYEWMYGHFYLMCLEYGSSREDASPSSLVGHEVALNDYVGNPLVSSEFLDFSTSTHTN